MREPFPHDQSILARATTALRNRPVPAGPTTELQRQTIAAIAGAGQARHRLTQMRIAAIFLLAVCGVTIGIRLHTSPQQQARDRRPEPKINLPASPPTQPALAKVEAKRGVHPSHVAPDAPAVIGASDTAVSGHVFYRGPRPARKTIDLRSYPQCAGVIEGTLYDDALVVNDGGALQNVVVSISGGLPLNARFNPPSEPVMLDQRGCMFRPHVVATMVGQSVIVKNSDPLLHTVHSTEAEQSPAFNFAQPTLAERLVEPLQVVETFSIKCDLHPWMNAWVRVFSHPYFALTKADGAFSISHLPPGTYRLKAWHESLGVQEESITVRQGTPTIVDFSFGNAVRDATRGDAIREDVMQSAK